MRKVINGLKVYHQNIADSPISEMRVCFFAGSRFDDKSGQAHFVEHAMFCGTNTMSEKAINDDIQNMGAFVNAMTTRESVTYYLQAISENFQQATDVLTHILNESHFPYKKINRERGSIKREIALRNTPDSASEDSINGHFFGDEFGFPITGTDDTVDSISRKDLIAFRDTYYNKSTCAISLIGDISDYQANAIMDNVDIADGSMPKRSKFKPPELPIGDGYFKIGELNPDEEIILTMRWPATPMGHELNPAIDLLTQVMSEGSASRLDGKLRMKHGISYGTLMDAMKYSDRGCVDLQGNFSKTDLLLAVDIIMKEVDKIKKYKISDRELQLNRNQLLLAARQSTMYPMLQGQEEVLSYMFDLRSPDHYIEKMMQVTAKDILHAANYVFKNPPLIYTSN